MQDRAAFGFVDLFAENIAARLLGDARTSASRISRRGLCGVDVGLGIVEQHAIGLDRKSRRAVIIEQITGSAVPVMLREIVLQAHPICSSCHSAQCTVALSRTALIGASSGAGVGLFQRRAFVGAGDQHMDVAIASAAPAR
jgi:hypothetical protein